MVAVGRRERRREKEVKGMERVGEVRNRGIRGRGR